MKKIYLMIALALLAGTTLVSSCKKESTITSTTKKNPIAESKLIVAINSPNDSIVYIYDKEFDLSFSVTSTEKLKKVYAAIIVNSTYLEDTTFYTDATSFNYSIKTSMPAGKIKLVVTATNIKDSAVTKTVDFDVVYDLIEYKDKALYNIIGTERGAYDLVNDERLSTAANNADKDLIDKGFVEGTFNWAKKWGTVNATTFVKADRFDYTDVSSYTLENLFNKGTPSTSTDVLEVGDVYVLKNEARFPHKYIIVKITQINSTPNDNQDFVIFSFKK